MNAAQGVSGRSSLVHELELGETTRAYHIGAVRFGLWLVLFAVGYYLTARFSQCALFQRSRIGLVWVPNALLLSALVLTSRRSWGIMLAVASAAHVLALGAVTPAWRMAWQIPVNATFVIATTEALRRLVGFPLRFDSRRGVLIYTGLALLMPVAIALTAPAFVMSVTGRDTFYSPGIAFARLVLANVTPTLLVAPAVLLAAGLGLGAWRALPRRRAAEIAGIATTVILAGVIVFDSGPEIARFPWLLALALPPLIWAAARLGPAGASISLLCVATLSAIGATRQHGPFVVNASDDAVLSMQLFWIAICPPVLLLAAAIREREEIAKALDDQRSQLAHVTRIATAGELSVELAHELRQPLTAIMTNAQAAGIMLARQPIEVGGIRTILSDIEQDARHADRLITQIRSFLKKREPQFEPLRIERIARDALALSGNALLRARVDVQSQFPDDLPRVRGDAVQLLQVVRNLIVNSCDAMLCTSAASRRLRLHATQPDAQHVELVIADTGIGLPNGEAERVFEPLFTTKPDGLGLGLAVARSIAIAHGGRLWGETNRENGATFHLVLPISRAT